MQIDFFLTLEKVAVLFLLIVIGFIAGKLKLISEQGQKDITQLVLYVTMPATIFSAMQLEMSQERLNTAFLVLGVMVFCYIIMFIVGFISSKRLPLTKGQKDIFQTALLLSNTSFMGYPIVQSLLGQEALFYAVVGAGFIFETVSWSLGVYLISRNGSESAGFNWKKVVFSPGILSIVVGLIFFGFQWSVPEPINSVINMMSPATSPLAMIVIGLMLSRSNLKEAFQNKFIYLASALKLLVVPIIITLALKAFGISGPALVIPVIMISMPTATYVAMFSGNYGNDSKFASQIVFMTSLLSMITIPIVTLLF
ncbi:AEC family transporter [Aerococcaceae bacterium DSM 109653]|uniref:AEC family transporter n=1 Tax=Fundicoccus ignavus TaxID=2664442 RepID=A0A6I2GCN6_9LACT|nr:AEC family transporter [Fundicoccus ignavus]MRI81593.1 AEC family transporter [Fundicoccus ignavus]MRI84364.1 AEC family transporter [Fundicoccus ignavus]